MNLSRSIHPRHSAIKGFTFAELLVVIIIVGIYAAISINTLNDLIANERFKTAVAAVTDYLEQARKKSIQNDYACKIEISNTNKTFNFVNLDPLDTTGAASGKCNDSSTNTLKLDSSSTGLDDLHICSYNLPASRDVTTGASLSSLSFTVSNSCSYQDSNPTDLNGDGDTTDPGENLTANPVDTASILYTPSGLTTSSTLIKIKRENYPTERCILLIAPTAIIRSGLKAGGQNCDFTNFN